MMADDDARALQSLALAPSTTSGGRRSSSLTSFEPGSCEADDHRDSRVEPVDLLSGQVEPRTVDTTQRAPLHPVVEVAVCNSSTKPVRRDPPPGPQRDEQGCVQSKWRSSRSSFGARRISDIDASRAAPGRHESREQLRPDSALSFRHRDR